MNNLKRNKMTAVEFLYERLERMIPRTALYNMDKEEYFKQAKEMEKKDICHFGAKCCFMTNQKKTWTIEELYNETFKNK